MEEGRNRGLHLPEVESIARMQINVLEYFLKTVEHWPSKLAVADGQQEWSFERLKQRAGTIARQIVKRTEAANQPIAIYFPKTNEAIAAFLGVLFSGNCYAPLDVRRRSVEFRRSWAN
jgi:D-alanine--poly(phosphoribitol) ligase subunit 1